MCCVVNKCKSSGGGSSTVQYRDVLYSSESYMTCRLASLLMTVAGISRSL